MRFIDEILQSKEVLPHYKDELDGVVVVNCESVSRFYYEGSDQEFWDYQDFPCIAPPWPRFWLDFRAPQTIVSRVKGIQPWGKDRPSAWGLLMDATPLSVNDIHSLLHDPNWGDTLEIIRAYALSLKWGIDVSLWWKSPQWRIVPHGWEWRYLVSDSGSLFLATLPGSEKRYMPALCGSRDPGIHGVLQMFIKQGMTPDEARNLLFDEFLPQLHGAWLALSFLNCKNVSLETITPPRKVYKAAAKKRGHQDFQPVPYRELVIEPMRQRLQQVQSTHGVGTAKALHICRGSFATYTEEHKLFGKHVGTFWRPMHVKGHQQQGVATKDYRIGPVPTKERD